MSSDQFKASEEAVTRLFTRVYGLGVNSRGAETTMEILQ